MQGRNMFLEDLLQKLDLMIDSLDEREQIEEDLSIARELADQLRDEIASLQE